MALRSRSTTTSTLIRWDLSIPIFALVSAHLYCEARFPIHVLAVSLDHHLYFDLVGPVHRYFRIGQHPLILVNPDTENKFKS